MSATTAQRQTGKTKDEDEARHLYGPEPHRYVELGGSDSLTPKHGIGHTLRLPPRGWLRLKLAT